MVSRRRLAWLVGVMAVVVGTIATATTPAHAVNGEHYNVRIRQEEVDQCLKVSSPTHGAQAYIGSCSSGGYRSWDIVDLLNGYHIIRLHGTYLCLTNPEWNSYYSLLYNCEGYGDQQWNFWTYHGSWNELWYSAHIASRARPDDCLVAPYWASYRPGLHRCRYLYPEYDDGANPWWDQIWVVYE